MCCNHTFNHRTEKITNGLKADLATNTKVFMGTPAHTNKHNWLQYVPGGQPRPGHTLWEDVSTAL